MGDDALARGKKNARRRRAWIVFQDESGVSQRPPVRRTWAPRGETPVLIHAFNWAKLSLAVGLAFRWDFRRSGLFFQTRPGSYNDVSLIGFLDELKRHFCGRPLDDVAGRAAQRATKTIPIVIVLIGDPVGGGFAATLSRPGGNVTGLTNSRRSSASECLVGAVAPKLLDRIARIIFGFPVAPR